jgi:NADPH:quinone reductase
VRAVVLREFGAPEVLTVEDVPDPEPGDAEVQIEVSAAGVHLLDAALRRGEPMGPGPAPSLPVIPGREVAGVVRRHGPAAALAVGTPVVVSLGNAGGGYAELAVAPAGDVHVVPEGLGFDDAVAMVGTGRTALAILEVAQPTERDIALVTGAAGGIGTLLVQALVAGGTTVVALAGGEKTAVPQSFGAVGVDYLRPAWPDDVRRVLAGRAVTLGLDGVGGDIGRGVLELLGVGGRLVIYGTASGRPTELSSADVIRGGITVTSAVGARLAARPGGLRPLATGALAAAADGRLRPLIGARYPLAEAAAAHRALEQRRTTGKVILHP